MAFLSTSDLVPLFQLFENCDNKLPHRIRSTPKHTFVPAFDVREFEDRYYLDGELPGVNQDNIDIEFSDAQSLVVKGRTERDYQTTEPSESPRSRQPTVEDDESDSSSNSDTASVNSKKVAVAAQHPKFRYWASERSVGQFERTFNFPSRVDQDAVSAKLHNGILSIVVPKEATPKAKKIRVQ